MKRRSRVLETVISTAKDLNKAGVMSDKKFQELLKMCNHPAARKNSK